MGDLPKGGAAAAGLMPADWSLSFLESNPSEICEENWVEADKATREIIRKVQPTLVSEDGRKKIVEYIERLIGNCLGAEVFPYGSVPLKTYLPDGEIDLTAFGGANVKDTWVDDIRMVLEEEGKNTASEFVVRDVQVICAEAKIVKCIVQDIVINVSFNQIGGLCTLCFLEQVDILIGKDHLFKRSIILIKAWCWYESRVLGAYFGLISTDALEMLVLYIFQFFHSTLVRPLDVLYKFLDYFSKFDWDTYCISLHGPVLISLMPDIVVEMPKDSARNLLLSNDFLSYCVRMFSVTSTSGDEILHAFWRKHLNIVDPLNVINNLGRSVRKGNFYRIRSAFSYGAQKLAQILCLPKISIANELHKFFPNTMARYGSVQRPDVQDFEPSQFLKGPISGVHIPDTVLPKIHNSHEFDGCANSSGFHTSGGFSKDSTEDVESTSSQMGKSKEHSRSVLKCKTVFQNRDQPSKPSTLDPIKHNPVIVVAPDGMVYIVDSGKILGSFLSGQSIYSSYQGIPSQEGENLNASSDSCDFFMDCGEDWELYLYKNGQNKMKLPLTAEEFVRCTPFVSTDGGVMLGSKKTAVYLVDANTGKIVRTFRSDDLCGADETSSLATNNIDELLPATPMDTEHIKKPIYVTRADYAVKYISLKTGKVLWYLTFAHIEASYQCVGIENFLGGFPHNKKFKSGQDLDTKLPMHCESSPAVHHFRDYFSLEAFLKANSIQGALPRGELLSLPSLDQQVIKPTPSLHIPNQHDIVPVDKFLSLYYNNENEHLYALPSSDHDKYMIKSLPGGDAPQISGHVESNGLPISLSRPSMLDLRSPDFMRQHKLAKTSEHLKPLNVMPEKREGRKSGVNKHIIAVKSEVGSQNGILEGDKGTRTAHRFLSFNPSNGNNTYFDGRTIGKLIITNKEIAKGSNGTIVLEGNYDGRSVAVKRLVRSHHSIAKKEIQNLIASDQHLNIVRWYGVEYDRDFIYICLERCTCNLQEWILACSSWNPVTPRDQDHESSSVINCNMQLLQTLGSGMGLKLCNANGYPSAWLLKLMRGIVCGLAHLHDLGIVHRDLKPQNVLIIIKYRSISAKISDMGISKHLDGDKSSLTRHATGFGSSGWQAPEQIRCKRQTRSVDLFSLGCILFFCMTGCKHPFGESFERDRNIVNDQKDLFLIEHIPEATDLITQLLNSDPNTRPTAREVINHPLFWESEKRLFFLRDVSDRVEREDREASSPLLKALESIGKVVLDGKWDKKMDNAFINDIGCYRQYKFDSIRDLLRVIRNKLNHYGELSKEIQALLGPVPEGFDSYFSTRFPKLLMEVYHVVVGHCGKEDMFNKYFRSERF